MLEVHALQHRFAHVETHVAGRSLLQLGNTAALRADIRDEVGCALHGDLLVAEDADQHRVDNRRRMYVRCLHPDGIFRCVSFHVDHHARIRITLEGLGLQRVDANKPGPGLALHEYVRDRNTVDGDRGRGQLTLEIKRAQQVDR